MKDFANYYRDGLKYGFNLIYLGIGIVNYYIGIYLSLRKFINDYGNYEIIYCSYLNWLHIR